MGKTWKKQPSTPFGNGLYILYHPCIVILGMVYDCFTRMKLIYHLHLDHFPQKLQLRSARNAQCRHSQLRVARCQLKSSTLGRPKSSNMTPSSLSVVILNGKTHGGRRVFACFCHPQFWENTIKHPNLSRNGCNFPVWEDEEYPEYPLELWLPGT